MQIDFHRRFSKEANRLSRKLRLQLRQRIDLFDDNPLEPTLRNHPLKGKYLGYRSIDITGDVRAIYHEVAKDHVEFTRVGTHSQLY